MVRQIKDLAQASFRNGKQKEKSRVRHLISELLQQLSDMGEKFKDDESALAQLLQTLKNEDNELEKLNSFGRPDKDFDFSPASKSTRKRS